MTTITTPSSLALVSSLEDGARPRRNDFRACGIGGLGAEPALSRPGCAEFRSVLNKYRLACPITKREQCEELFHLTGGSAAGRSLVCRPWRTLPSA
jgi:hypothetical protein